MPQVTAELAKDGGPRAVYYEAEGTAILRPDLSLDALALSTLCESNLGFEFDLF